MQHLQMKRQALQSEASQLLKLETDVKPSSICKLTGDIIVCASDTTSEVYTITVASNGHVLCGSVTPLLSYPERCKCVQSMCLGSQNCLFLADTKGFWQFNMAQKTLERTVVLQSDPTPSNDEDSGTHEEDAVDAVPVNFLSRTVRTRTGRPITLSNRALSSY